MSTAVVAGARLALAAAQPASDGSHTGSPTTAKRALQTLTVALESRFVLVMQPPTCARSTHARVVREDVETWPSFLAGTPAAGLGTKGGQEGLVVSR